MNNRIQFSNEAFSSILARSSSIIVVINEDLKVTFISPSFQWTLGYDAEEIKGKSIVDYIHPDDQAIFLSEATRIFQDNAKEGMLDDLRLSHSSGSWIFLEGEMISLLDNPEVNGIFLNLSDITRRKLYEAEYRRLLSGVSISDDGFIISDSEGNIVFVNEAACGYYGCESRRDLIGHKISEVTGRETFGNIRNRLEHENNISQFEHLFYPLHGEPVEVESSVNLIPASGGAIEGYVFSVRDVTLRKKTERELESYRQKLEERVRDRTAELQESMSRLENTLQGIVQAMARAVESRDPYTAGHQRRVADLACAIASEMGKEENFIAGIRLAALIHDLGKIYVPAELLTRPGRLDEVEMMLIRKHPVVGYEILKGIDFPWPIADVVYQHHERLDGTGYPKGISGDDIIPEARIIAVADVVESMATNRPYRHSPGLGAALEEIKKNRGAAYDEDVVRACVNIFKKNKFTLD